MSLHDAVALVADRLALSPALSEKILESTRSELRGFKFQNPYGTFGSGDNDLKRASALLEYVAREQGGVKIPMAKLSKAAYLRERDFTKFHRQIGNFRSKKPVEDPWKTAASTSSSSSRSSIPSLAMKLGSYLTDSNGVAIRAQRLLNQISRFSRNNPHQIRDIFRFHKAYEAVCFYVVATQDASPAGGSSTSTSARRKDEDGDEGKQLQVATVVDVSTDVTLSEFANILEHVHSMIEDMKEKESTDRETSKHNEKVSSSKKRKAGKRTSTKDEDPSSSVGEGDSAKRSAKRSRAAAQAQDLLEEVKARADFMESLNDDPFDEKPSSQKNDEPPELSYSVKFLEWKRQVLAQATQSATTILLEKATAGHNSSDQSATVTLEQSLEYAARNVLTSLGLLQARS